jgi:phage terminase large subunit-like protein
MRLGMFQKEFLEDALADGIDVAIAQMARANGKSTLGGGLAVWAAYDDDETGVPQVPIIATTVSQAIRSVYGVGASMVKAEPELEKRALIYTGIAQPRILVVFNGGELFPISNDTDGLQGLDPSLAICDEMGFMPLVSWDSLRLASGKRERSLTVGLGTPGLDRENAMYHVRTLVREGVPTPGVVFREYSAPDGCELDDRDAWRAANPALVEGFLRESAIETDLAITPEGHFRVFRLGQWYEGVDSWLGPNGGPLWDALRDPYEFAVKAPTWVGIDVGLKRDSTAVSTFQRRPDGRLHVKLRVWVPTADEPVDVTDVMGYLRELDRTYDLRAASFDPRFFDVPAKMLADEGLPMVEIPQSVERMTPICGTMLETIKRGELSHDGDPILRTHVLNAVPRINERGFTLQKSKSRGRIDGCISTALGLDQAIHAPPPRPALFVGVA